MRAISVFALILMANSTIAAPKDPYSQLDELVSALPADDSPAADRYQAIDALAQSQLRDPKFQVKVAELLAARDPKRAFVYANNAVTLVPLYVPARSIRANIEYKMTDYESALADAKLVLQIEPGNLAAQSMIRLIGNRPNASAANIREARATPVLAGYPSARPPAPAVGEPVFTQRPIPKRSPFSIETLTKRTQSEGMEDERPLIDKVTSLWAKAEERGLERVDYEIGIAPNERGVAATGAVGGMVLAGAFGGFAFIGLGTVACAPMRVFAGITAHAACAAAVAAGGALATSPFGAYYGGKFVVKGKRSLDRFLKDVHSIAPTLRFGAADEH